MARRRREGGVTLIEIMLSLLVMVLGLLGILAVFPVGLQSSSESVEETYAAILSESVSHAFKNAVQFGKYDATASEWTCVMAHDLLAGGTAVRFTFALPKLADGWKQYPGGGAIDKGKVVAADPEQDSHFELCGDQWTYATVQNVWTVNDPTDPWKQFAFSFVIKKINTLEYLMRPVPQINPATGAAYTLNDLEPLTKLYELRVRVFRVANQAAGAGSAASSRKKLISEVTYRVCTR
jgi:Tfp pilus assembly protein PilV